mmetsp:Transcript_9121/g.15934  ORF Transcript_9121/g.15934 Transcript_9121/m.15934 type:complete len:507 (-) Transcript_9121:653-2173(-)|eukprot:CAMPEP_0119109396 /NCGR_PEP_ID=MMETSP1180-20130426/17887_1 /TAXON_ID=3052 ORGANISM="Chlamydomonas cf sp, Strain CCMP681" /NCGR_SAMPLE_ID=MMETSP1180 /ASSEMBLY_ACC=CAM_ASM_000741 /LENGTH=506 /DNA_ID=CAMNT_0007095149 /DNA_START=183 /DNA_END=1703 /DNA_ORIENTATION=-
MSANGDKKADQTQPAEQPVEEPRYSTSYIIVCLLGYSLSFIIFGSQVSILGPTINALAQRLNVSEPDLSPLFTALGVSCIISGTPSGWVVDRFPSHYVLIGSLLVEAIGFALVPLMPSVWSLTALYFVICFSYNFTNSAVFTSLGWMFPKRTGSALNLVLAMFGVGSFFIPLAAQACKYLLGSALAVFWVVSIMSVISTIPFLFVASPTPPPPILNGDGPNPFKASKRVERLELITTVAVVSLVFCTTAAETAVGNWLYTYGVREAGLTDDTAAFANSAFWGFFTIGRVLGAAVSHATTPAVLLLASTPVALLGASLPLWATHLLTPGQLVMATAMLTGLGNSTGYANAVSLLERYVPVTGFVNGLFGMVAGAACMVGPTTVAMLAQHTSLRYSAMAWVAGTFYLLHVPAILTTVFAGNRLLELYATPGEVDRGSDQGDEEVAEGLQQPLLTGQGVDMPGGGRHVGRESHDGRLSYRQSGSLRRQGSVGTGSRVPGHATPIAGSMG